LGVVSRLSRVVSEPKRIFREVFKLYSNPLILCIL
jgi:hypothetical protein